MKVQSSIYSFTTVLSFCTSYIVSCLVSHQLVHISMPCSFTVLFNISLLVVGLQMWRVKKAFSKVLKPLRSALTIHQRTCYQWCYSACRLREALRLVTLSRVLHQSNSRIASWQADCLLTKVQSFVLTS